MKAKALLILVLTLLFSSCMKKSNSDPLLLPPNFSELPDPKNPEIPTDKSKEEDIARLKELLLKSD